MNDVSHFNIVGIKASLSFINLSIQSITTMHNLLQSNKWPSIIILSASVCMFSLGDRDVKQLEQNNTVYYILYQ